MGVPSQFHKSSQSGPVYFEEEFNITGSVRRECRIVCKNWCVVISTEGPSICGKLRRYYFIVYVYCSGVGNNFGGEVDKITDTGLVDL